MGLTKPRAAQIYNLDYKQATRVVAVTTITLAGGAPATVDGVSLSLNDRVLVTAQSTGSQNGLYYVTTVGSGSNGTWTRTTDANQTGEIDAGMIVMVTEGTVYADTQWKLITDNPITVGTTALTFTQNYSANSISGGTSNVTVYSNANVTISSAGTANVLTVTSSGLVVANNLVVTSPSPQAEGGQIVLTWANISGISGQSNSTWNLDVDATNNFRIFSQNAAGQANVSATFSPLNGNITITGNVNPGAIYTNGYYYANGTAFTGGGGGGTPGGANTQIQYNNNGVFGGSAGFTFNNTTNAIATTGTISTTGTITAASTVGGIITGTSTSVTGNTTSGNILTGGLISATGNITGGNIISTGTSGNITGANVISATTFSATGNTTSGNLLTSGLISATSTITGTSHLGAVVSVTGAVTAASVVGGVITGTSTSVSGGVTAASVSGGVITGSSLSVSGTVTGTAHNGTSVSVSGGVTAASVSGGVITGSSTSVTGTQTAASTVGGVITGSSISVSGAVTGASVVGGVITGTSTSVTGSQTAASTVGGVITGSSLSVTTGTITGGNIVNGNGNGVGNIGSSTTYFNTVFAKATSAQYADLAEMYCGDKLYSPGTVVDFGGTNEITTTAKSHSTRVAGIISTNPSYLMNSALDCTTALEVALVGRVPCSVVGTIHKGDRLVSSDLPGVAQALNMSQYQPGCIIGKSLEDYNSAEPGVIEVAVGRV